MFLGSEFFDFTLKLTVFTIILVVLADLALVQTFGLIMLEFFTLIQTYTD
jgi:hypothetical protein